MISYNPTLACVLNGHSLCIYRGACSFETDLWQFAHCYLCGYVKMELDSPGGIARWEPVDGMEVT